MIYKAMYKCRLCGKVYEDGTVAGKRNVAVKEISLLLFGSKIGKPISLSMQTLHFCDSYNKGDIGVADFIGWKEEPDT